jgi:hypothetical protein
MSVKEVIDRRGITSILHFTTSNGFLGMISGETKQVLPRKRLSSEKHLEFIATPNTEVRHDTDWIDYVNLSISKINPYFFKYSLNNHPAVKWIILDFAPDILTHSGVVFTTTNNIYPKVSRAEGASGLEALFVPSLDNGKRVLNRSGRPDNVTTCSQAEVLYPGPLSLDFLNKIHVKDDNDQALIQAQAAVCWERKGVIAISPELFVV